MASLDSIDVLLFMEQETCSPSAAPWIPVVETLVAAGGRVVVTTSRTGTAAFINGLGVFGTGSQTGCSAPFTTADDLFWTGITHPGYLNGTDCWNWSGDGLVRLAWDPDDPSDLSVWGYNVEDLGILVPGRTDIVVSIDGWSARCLEWSGAQCRRPLVRVDCATCAAYPSCGAWHDVTNFNNHDGRGSESWCGLATGDRTVAALSAGGTATEPRACGWGSSDHPLCDGTRSTYHPDVPGINAIFGIMVNDGYCRNSATRLYVECGGW